jgi:phytanoyl-CoA hydroxylase
MEPRGALPWPGMDLAVPLPVQAGTLVVFGGLLPHCSLANRSPRSRLAYTLHATDAGAAYDPLNWLQRSAALPVRGFA